MLIRTEAPADILPLDRLLKANFETDAEANLVMTLRENGQLTLSLVACTDEGELVGHVLFSPVTLDGQDDGWQGLAPLSVAAQYRGQGIGRRLVEEGLTSLAELGYPVCVVLGEPDYYARLGFSAAHHYDMRCEWDAPLGAFQIQALYPDTLTGRHGVIAYCPEFYALGGAAR